PGGQVKLRIGTDASSGLSSHLWFDTLGNAVLYYPADGDTASVRIDDRWVSLFSVGGQHPLAVPTQILKTEIWPRHPMQFDRAAIESVQLEVSHPSFSTFALDYEFDDNLRPSRISCTIDGELAFEVTIDSCPDTTTETTRYSDGTSYSTDFKLDCRGAELGPPNEWTSCL